MIDGMDEIFVELIREVARTDGEAFAPREDVHEGETVVGEATPFMRKLYSLSEFFEREARQAALDHRYSSREESPCSEMEIIGTTLQAKGEALMAIFWLCARGESKQWANHIGVRKDWKLVTYEENPRETMLKKLFAGLGG